MSAGATWQDVIEGRARWAVVHGDNAEILPQMPDRSVAHVITDPPYEAEAHTKQRRVGGSEGGVKSAALVFPPITEQQRDAFATHSARVSARWSILFCQVEAATRWGAPLSANGAPVRRIGVWVKPDGMPQFSGDRPGMGYETIVFAHQDGRCRWNGGGKTGVFVHNCGRDPNNKTEHQTQKPLELMLELVELFTDPDDIVLDPFTGSGTTGVACLRLGRRFIGMELSAEYAAIARERLAAESQGLSLRDARAGQQSLFGSTP